MVIHSIRILLDFKSLHLVAGIIVERSALLTYLYSVVSNLSYFDFNLKHTFFYKCRSMHFQHVTEILHDFSTVCL